jgi:hypothetical protein
MSNQAFIRLNDDTIINYQDIVAVADATKMTGEPDGSYETLPQVAVILRGVTQPILVSGVTVEEVWDCTMRIAELNTGGNL